MNLKISQSLIKSYYDYTQGKLCGVFFKARYVDKNPKAETPPTDAMKLGIYFEYLSTGALPKNGIVPEPDISYKGQAREKLSAPYERAKQSAEAFKRIIEHYKIKIKEVGYLIQDKDKSGVVDIWAEWDGEDVFIDLKYSGLIDDKWNENGWDLDSLPLKDSIMIQGVHYKLLARENNISENIPFYYFVFDTNNPNNIKIIKQNVDESRIASHELTVSTVKQRLSNDINYGFKAYPSMSKCVTCPLKEDCSHAIDYPLIDEVYY